MSTPRVRVYLACSLDGFVAGHDHDLSWLEPPDEEARLAREQTEALTYEQFTSAIGAMLMGRQTYDVVSGFDGWPYGDTPVLVATHRPLTPVVDTVRAVSGDLSTLIADGLAAAGGKDLYVDGGNLVRQAIRADLVDELVLTMVPVLLGGGVRLFGELEAAKALRFTGHAAYGDMVQLTATRR